MTRLALKDALLDAQLLRVAGTALYGGADLGECLATARRIDGTDVDSWFAEWAEAGKRAQALGEEAQERGERETARLAYLRASNYWRNAGIMLLRPPLDSRLVESNLSQTELFLRAAELTDPRPDILEIPFGNTTLAGYFFRACEGRRATVILTGGYDSTVEETYFTNGAAALTRGYNVLMFDGPGQGAALIEQGLTLRPDWEKVVGPVVDYAQARPDVDRERIALIGASLGAHLAPRAASAEHRLSACVADCGAFDLHAMFLSRLPAPLARRLERGNRFAVAATRRLLATLAEKPTAGWALRRGQLVHGIDDPIDLLEELRRYTLEGRAEHIECPTWVCHAEDDDISASAPQLVAALTCPHEYVRFTAGEGADDHCESGARALYHARSFGWLDALLAPRHAAEPETAATATKHVHR